MLPGNSGGHLVRWKRAQERGPAELGTLWDHAVCAQSQKNNDLAPARATSPPAPSPLPPAPKPSAGTPVPPAVPGERRCCAAPPGWLLPHPRQGRLLEQAVCC